MKQIPSSKSLRRLQNTERFCRQKNWHNVTGGMAINLTAEGDKYASQGEFINAAQCYITASDFTDNVRRQSYNLTRAGTCLAHAGMINEAFECFDKASDLVCNDDEQVRIITKTAIKVIPNLSSEAIICRLNSGRQSFVQEVLVPSPYGKAVLVPIFA